MRAELLPVRGLPTHADSGYEEWGASGSLRLDPGRSSRGLSLTLAPVWGAASGGVERLWGAGPARSFALDDTFEAEAGLEAELGYGLHPPAGPGVLTPYAGFSMASGAAERTYRIGARWTAEPAFALALETRHGRAHGDTDPAATTVLRASFRW